MKYDEQWFEREQQRPLFHGVDAEYETEGSKVWQCLWASNQSEDHPA